MKKAVTLLSGGLDSCTTLAIAINDVGKENVTAVSCYYGQKHSRELDCAKQITEYFGVNHSIIDLSKTGVLEGSNCSLLQQSTEDLPTESYAEQIAKSQEEGKSVLVSSFVPFRNGWMLSSVAALAMSVYPEEDVDIYLGNHADDAAGNAYPDCSQEFVDAIGKAIEIGTYGKVHLKSPLVSWNKARVVEEGLKLHAPYHLTTSCYNGGDKACGCKCATCLDRVEAFRKNHVIDPVDYANFVDWRDCQRIDYLADVYDNFDYLSWKSEG